MSNSSVIEAKLHVRYHTSELKSFAITFAAPTPMCAMNASRVYTAHTSKCFQCKHISYLYSILMESCIRRAVRGEFIPRYILRFYPATHAIPGKWRMRRECVTTRISRICIVRAGRVAFAPVILNIKENIPILVDKHIQITEHGRARSFVCAYTRVPFCAYPYAMSRIL